MPFCSITICFCIYSLQKYYWCHELRFFLIVQKVMTYNHDFCYSFSFSFSLFKFFFLNIQSRDFKSCLSARPFFVVVALSLCFRYFDGNIGFICIASHKVIAFPTLKIAKVVLLNLFALLFVSVSIHGFFSVLLPN